MSLKPSVKYIDSGEISSPGSTVTGGDIAAGNLASSTMNMLPSTGSLSNLISGPLTMSKDALSNASTGVMGSITGLGDVLNVSSVPGGIGGLGSISPASIGNGIISNATSIAGSIGGSVSSAIAGSITSIGQTFTDNINAISGSINGLKQDIAGTVDTFNNVTSAAAAGDVGAIVSNIIPSLSFNTSPSTNNELSYPETLKNVSLNPAHIHFQFYIKNSQEKSTSIHLPMPDEVMNPSTINWEATDFGMMGNAAVKVIKSVKGNQVNQADIKAELNSMAERVKSVAFYHAASEVVNGLGGNQLSPDDIMGASSGKMTNPYKTFLFRGVNFRTFNFSFNLVPFSESDCTLIDKIVTKFREHSYPGFAGEKMFFEYPDECKISYMWESNHNKWLNNFKRAVCSGINANFAPLGQWASLRNGFPYMIQLQTTWTEVEIITKEDIQLRDTNGQRS